MIDGPAGESIPAYDTLLNPTLEAIRSLGGSASIAEITDRVIETLGLTTAIVQTPHGRGSRTELEYRLAWSRTYLKKYGLIDNSERGIWSFTASGLTTPEVEPREVIRFVRELAHGQQEHAFDGETLREQGEEPIDDSSVETASWRESLMNSLLSMNPDAFERLCQRVLRESGFIEVKVTGKSGDDGIDGHGIIRLAGLIGFPVMFQCKRYIGTVGPGAVRDFRGAMVGRADKGLILTTGGFTKNAYEEATRAGAPPIDLIDGELLMDKLKELRLGVNVKMVEAVEIDRSWFEST